MSQDPHMLGLLPQIVRQACRRTLHDEFDRQGVLRRCPDLLPRAAPCEPWPRQVRLFLAQLFLFLITVGKHVSLSKSLTGRFEENLFYPTSPSSFGAPEHAVGDCPGYR